MTSNNSLKNRVENLDNHGFVGMLYGAVSHFQGSYTAANDTDISSIDVSKVTNIVILGMGGSGSTGDIINAAFSDQLKLPVSVVKTYDLPSFVGENSLVFATSYSGNTEETVEATKQALANNAQIVFTSSGGLLEEMAKEHKKIHIPLLGGLQPRAAFATLFPIIVSVLNRLDFITFTKEDEASMVALLEKKLELFEPANETDSNLAYAISKELKGKTTLIYGGDVLGQTASYRVKCDFNENAKLHAFSHAYPELDHNEICAWDETQVDFNKAFMVLDLRTSYESERTSLRFDITKQIIAGANVVSYQADGSSRLEQLVDTIYFGLWLTSYLAVSDDVDPGYIKNIVQLKVDLANN